MTNDELNNLDEKVEGVDNENDNEPIPDDTPCWFCDHTYKEHHGTDNEPCEMCDCEFFTLDEEDANGDEDDCDEDEEDEEGVEDDDEDTNEDTEEDEGDD